MPLQDYKNCNTIKLGVGTQCLLHKEVFARSSCESEETIQKLKMLNNIPGANETKSICVKVALRKHVVPHHSRLKLHATYLAPSLIEIDKLPDQRT